MPIELHGTTVICVTHKGQTAIAADGQITFNNTVMKTTAKKVRRIYNNKVVVGFAGATADAITLEDKFEKKLEEFSGNITRAAVEMAKEWRTDKVLRHLEAMLIAANAEKQYLITGSGDVIEPEDGIIAIGSGGPFARSAAIALMKFSDLSAVDIVKEAMNVAASICIYTNTNINLEVI